MAMLMAFMPANPLVPGDQALADALFYPNLRNQHSKPQTPIGLLSSLNSRSIDLMAGAFLNGTDFKAITAQFTVPTIKLLADVRLDWQECAAAWVSLDPLFCPFGAVQTGVIVCISGTNVTYYVWSEWNHCHTMDDLSIGTDDIVRITMNTTTPSTGTVIVENISNGKIATQEFAGDSARGSLCSSYAEIILEEYLDGSYLIPIVELGSFMFFNLHTDHQRQTWWTTERNNSRYQTRQESLDRLQSPRIMSLSLPNTSSERHARSSQNTGDQQFTLFRG
ncbi:unnamed protein product [Penicillium bialowiezense]